MRRSDWLGILIIGGLCFGIAALGGWITAPAIPAWHAHLNKPAWNPPNWIFGPVWTTLYLMMAASGGIIWCRRDKAPVSLPAALFLIQLALNLGWTILFFGLYRIDLASWEILALAASILATLIVFRRRSLLAGILLAPYLLWVTFASFLCWEIWRLNP